MAQRSPGMFLVAAGILLLAVAMAYGAFRAFAAGGPGLRALGSVLALGSFLGTLAALAAVVLAFGVDFK
jgi:hypothetical protein